jgi:AcrR family transcriptional regulator
MDDRTRRIVDTALELAEDGGFQAVRLRDVAAGAGVALGTLYNHFHCKEDILIAVLEQEVGKLEAVVEAYPPAGDGAIDRVRGFFVLATRGLFQTPNLARALLRSVASGEPEIAQKVLRYHQRITRLIVRAMKGGETWIEQPPPALTHDEETLGFLLAQVWFASLVGWMGGLHDVDRVVEQVSAAAAIILRGAGIGDGKAGA